jgi:serine/threonine protein kinase
MANEPGASLSTFGQFVLLEKIGHGGMGNVFKATHPNYPSPIALKVAHRRVAQDPELSARFQNEYLLASEFRHPRVVAALDHGKEESLPYLVLEFIPGRSLAQQLKDDGPLSLAETITVFSQVAEAIGFIHDNRLVHRDIKPANILLDPVAGAKIADLGMVKDLNATSSLTRSRVGLGTMEFAAPEQFDDAKHVDHSCDIYGLAATLYLALAGRPVFGPASLATVLRRKYDHQFTPLSVIVPTISTSLDQTITRALHPDPAMRPATVADFVAGLQGKATFATLLVPNAPPPPKPSDRRTQVRYSVNAPTSCETLLGSAHVPCPAQILDISTGGVCLEVPRRFEPKTNLQVSLPGAEPGLETTLISTVRWVKALTPTKWMLGCAFMRPLDEKQLDTLLGNDLSRTNVIKSPPHH